MQSLRRDPILASTAVAVAGLTVVSFALPLSKPVITEISWWADFPLLGFSAFAAWRASVAERGAWGRRFWKLVVLALCLWFAVLLDWQFTWGERLPFDGEVLVDFLFLAYYFALLLATAVRPHVRADSTRLSPILLTEVVAGAVLVFGLLEYFVVLPSRIAPKSYETYVPSLSLYVLLDVLLVSRVAWWCRTTRGSRWRTTYCALAASFGFTLLHDIHELIVYTEGKSLEPSPWDLVWWGQFLFLVLAARASALTAANGEVGAEATGDEGVGHPQALLGPVASFAFMLPVIHLGGRVADVLDPALDRPREIVVLACAVALGALAIVHQRLMNDRYRTVSRRLHEAQIQLQQSRKMEALGRLAGGVAHGFNNMLSVIVGYAEMLTERCAPGDKTFDALQQIRLAAERAASLTRQLATFSRGRLDREEWVDVDATLSGLLPTLQRLLSDRVTLQFRPGGGGACVQTDPGQFERAIVNIVANARDAMPDGGALRLTTRPLVLGEAESPSPGMLPPGRYVEVELTDTGHGMDEEVLSRLFEPFFTTRDREGRRGLGLPIVYGVVRQAAGHIEVDSRPGSGTTVRLILPRRQAATAVPAAEPVVLGDRPSTVLLAEDERGLRRLIRSTLELEGFRVLEAGDGGSAVDVAERHPGTIDLLLSDVVMPVLGGPEVARTVLASRPETRVLFISGYAPETLGDLRVPGTRASLLPKPFTMAELVAKVRAQIPGSPGTSAPGGTASPSVPPGTEATA
jgi:signal transduction histidine kinase/CheY-like chemotaxis protein